MVPVELDTVETETESIFDPHDTTSCRIVVYDAQGDIATFYVLHQRMELIEHFLLCEESLALSAVLRD